MNCYLVPTEFDKCGKNKISRLVNRSKLTERRFPMELIKSLKHTKWDCRYHIVWVPKYRRKVLCGDLRKYLGEVLRDLVQ